MPQHENNNGAPHVHGNDCIYKEAERHFSPFIACNNMKITTDEHTCTKTIVYARRLNNAVAEPDAKTPFDA